MLLSLFPLQRIVVSHEFLEPGCAPELKQRRAAGRVATSEWRTPRADLATLSTAAAAKKRRPTPEGRLPGLPRSSVVVDGGGDVDVIDRGVGWSSHVVCNHSLFIHSILFDRRVPGTQLRSNCAVIHSRLI